MRICKKCGKKVTHSHFSSVCSDCRKTKGATYKPMTIIKRDTGLNEGKNYKDYNPECKEEKNLWGPTTEKKYTKEESEAMTKRLNELLNR